MTLRKDIMSLIFLVILCLQTSCRFMGKSENENLILEKEEYFTIDPLTLMNAINQSNKENLFNSRAPFTDQSEMWSLPEEKTVYWKQNDYFQIAQALNEYLGNEPLENWKIKMVSLDYDCTDTGLGFTRGYFRFFKINQSEKQGTRTVLTMDIMPWRKIIRAYEAVYSPILENWDSLDFQKIKISSKQAIEIAENNGGIDARNKIANKCFVTISMIAPGSGYGGWTVNYSAVNENSASEDVYKVLIDPQDGKFLVITP